MKNEKQTVTESISVGNRNDRFNGRTIISKSKFFSTEIVIKYADGKLTFRKPILEDKKTRKPTMLNSKFYCLITSGIEIPIGKFDFDADESNEDCITIYCQ